MALIGDPKWLNKDGWLRRQTEEFLREQSPPKPDGTTILPFVPELLDEIDRLRALLQRTFDYVEATTYQYDVGNSGPLLAELAAALANTRAQE